MDAEHQKPKYENENNIISTQMEVVHAKNIYRQPARFKLLNGM